jgi:Protein kinase domain
MRSGLDLFDSLSCFGAVIPATWIMLLQMSARLRAKAHLPLCFHCGADSGSSWPAGEAAPLSFTPSYAAPEVIAAYEAGARTLIASPAADVWSLGLVAFEMLTGEPAFPALSMQEIVERLAGRAALPWEGPRRTELLRKLRSFKANVMDCLHRDPARRPPMISVVRGWEHLIRGATVTATVAATVQRGDAGPL